MLSLLHNWDSFLYQFSVGGIIFLFGIIFPFIKGDVKWSRPDDRHTILAIFIGIGIFVALFILWQLYAIRGG